MLIKRYQAQHIVNLSCWLHAHCVPYYRDTKSGSTNHSRIFIFHSSFHSSISSWVISTCSKLDMKSSSMPSSSIFFTIINDVSSFKLDSYFYINSAIFESILFILFFLILVYGYFLESLWLWVSSQSFQFSRRFFNFHKQYSSSFLKEELSDIYSFEKVNIF